MFPEYCSQPQHCELLIFSSPSLERKLLIFYFSIYIYVLQMYHVQLQFVQLHLYTRLTPSFSQFNNFLHISEQVCEKKPFTIFTIKRVFRQVLIFVWTAEMLIEYEHVNIASKLGKASKKRLRKYQDFFTPSLSQFTQVTLLPPIFSSYIDMFRFVGFLSGGSFFVGWYGR